jgi:hypothetical protein
MVPPAAWKQIQRIGRVGNEPWPRAASADTKPASAPPPYLKNDRRVVSWVMARLSYCLIS